jgi:cytochrome c oxidase assembly factor CtaG
MGNDNALISQWFIPIATNIIAAIIIFLARPSFALGKRLFAKGKNKLKVSDRFKNKPIKAFLKYAAWVSVGLVPIAYNVNVLYHFAVASGPPSRGEVLLVVLFISATAYWLRVTIDKLKYYGPSDYI